MAPVFLRRGDQMDVTARLEVLTSGLYERRVDRADRSDLADEHRVTKWETDGSRRASAVSLDWRV